MDKSFPKLRSSGLRPRQILFRTTIHEKIRKMKTYRDNLVISVAECYSEIKYLAKRTQHRQESLSKKETEMDRMRVLLEAHKKDVEEREKKVKNIEEWEKVVSCFYEKRMEEMAPKALELNSMKEEIGKEVKDNEEKLLEPERKILVFLKKLSEAQTHIETSRKALSKRKKVVIQRECSFMQCRVLHR